MSFAIFIHREDSIYADEPARHYQFPKQYLSRVREAIGDWVIYYEPTKVPETRGYYAVAKVADVIEDVRADGMYLARIEPGTYLEFSNPIPFMLADGRAERGTRGRGRGNRTRMTRIGHIGADWGVIPLGLGCGDGEGRQA